MLTLKSDPKEFCQTETWNLIFFVQAKKKQMCRQDSKFKEKKAQF